MAINVSIDCKHIEDFKTICYIDSDTLSPKTHFIAELMNAVGVYRLFTREQFLHFMYRLAFIHQKMGMLKRYFADGTLFVIKVNGNDIPVKLDDFLEHFGLVISNRINNMSTGSWFWIFAKRWNNFYFNGPIQKYIPDEDYFIYKIPERITPKLARPAIMFQKEIDNEVKREFYDAWSQRNSTALTDYHSEVKRRNFKWDISKIPIDVVHKCHDHIDKFFPVCDVTYNLAEELMRLAWYYANDYVYKTFYGNDDTYPEFTYNLDLLETCSEVEKVNDLNIVRDEYELDKIEHLLKFDWRMSYKKTRKRG